MPQVSASLLRPDEVAERLGVHPATVYRWIDAGVLRTVKAGITRPSRRVREDDLAEFIRRRTEGEEVA